MTELCQGFCNRTLLLSAVQAHINRGVLALLRLSAACPSSLSVLTPQLGFSHPHPAASWEGSSARSKLWRKHSLWAEGLGSSVAASRPSKGRGTAPQSIKLLSLLQRLASF